MIPHITNWSRWHMLAYRSSRPGCMRRRRRVLDDVERCYEARAMWTYEVKDLVPLLPIWPEF